MSQPTTLPAAEQPTATPLTTLADEINDHHHKAEAAMRSGLEHALEAGRLLEEAKGQCPHGSWGPWLEENFDGSQRTARAYMQVARRWPELEAKRQTSADLSIDGALRLLAKPDVDKDGATDFRKECADAARAIDLPELADTIVLLGQSDKGTIWIEPDAENPGYFFVSLVEDLDDGEGLLTYGRRPCAGWAVGAVLKQCSFGDVHEWCSGPATGKKPWYCDLPGKRAPDA